jgi:hypothetical protein
LKCGSLFGGYFVWNNKGSGMQSISPHSEGRIGETDPEGIAGAKNSGFKV